MGSLPGGALKLTQNRQHTAGVSPPPTRFASGEFLTLVAFEHSFKQILHDFWGNLKFLIYIISLFFKELGTKKNAHTKSSLSNACLCQCRYSKRYADNFSN